MKLAKLYEVQAKLKDRIGYKGEDKFEKMMLAFLVEVGECANEWRGFKYWSKNQKPTSKLLEEFVDGLHFVLELGLDLLEARTISGLPSYIVPKTNGTITKKFKTIIQSALLLEQHHSKKHPLTDVRYWDLIEHYVGLGEMLGFTCEEIEAAYMEKNKINHERQENGY
jgi:dimeric dUTPase (all-alpha-NTP-PPase superfamily)